MELNIEKYHLKSTSLFDFLTKEEILFVKGNLQRLEFLKGTLIFAENSYSRGVYIIKKGKVKIFQSNSDGKNSIVYIYRKGDYFGYRPLLAGEPHPVSAVAIDNVVISFIPREAFITILNKSNNFARKLLEVLSQEFSVWVNKLTVFVQYGVRERVALSLIILNKVYQRDNEKQMRMEFSINREDLASYVGTAKETLVRMLRTFKNDELITTKGSKIVLLNYNELLSIVNNLK